MAPTITGLQNDKVTISDRAWIVEIVGPAGSGKTTLFQSLAKFEPGIHAEFLPPVWNIGCIPFFVQNIFQLIPTLVRLHSKGDRSLTRRELAWLAMLKGWPKLLRKKAKSGGKAILLDQGPIFLMAILSEFGPVSLRNENVQGYWIDIYKRWAQTLDMVIWLDTSDENLMARIRNRQMDHEVKDKTDQEIKDYLGKYRAAYERLIKTTVEHNREIHVIRLDTGKYSPDELVRCVLVNLPVQNGNQGE